MHAWLRARSGFGSQTGSSRLYRTAGDPQVGREEHSRMLLEQGDEFVVDIFVADQMREAFDSRPHEPFGVLQVVNMGNGTEIVLARFIDGRSVKFRRQLLLGMVSVVHPDLDEVGTMGRQVLHGASRLLDSCDHIRHVIP